MEIAKPLNELMKKTKIVEWSQECQTAFENLKEFLEKPVLIAWSDKTVLRQIWCIQIGYRHFSHPSTTDY